MDHLNPSAADLQGLKSIKRIRFISEEYVEPGHPKATFNLESNLQSIFKAFTGTGGWFQHDAAQYDATLTIKINGHFIGEKYVKSGRSSSGSFHTYGKPFILYVGSRIDGTISLDSNLSAVYNWSFDNKFNFGPPKKPIEPSRFRWSVELEPVYSRIYGMLGDICGGEALALALNNKATWGVYFWAAKKSFKYLADGETAVAPLISIIQDKTLRSAIRSGAMEALGDIDGDTAFEFLISAVKEERSLDAAKALGNRGDVRAVEPLIDLLKHCGPKQSYCETVTAGAP